MDESIIRTDIFDYGKAYQAYRDGTDDERNGLLINHLFLKSLQVQGFFSYRDKVTLVADIGCGEGDTIIKYLKDIQFNGGLDIRAFDANPEFIGQGDDGCDSSRTIDENAPAIRNFSKAKELQIIPLKSYRIRHGDLMRSDLPLLLYTEQELQQSKSRFDLIYFSHTIYYARHELENGITGVTKVLDSVATQLLSENGITILFHSNLKPDSFSAICRYHLNLIQDIIPTDEECKRLSMDHLITSSCNELGLTYFEIPYHSGLYFSKNFKNYIDIFKDVNRYHEIRNNNEALQDLYRLMFLSHRPISEALADSPSRGWDHLVDSVVNMLDKYGRVNIFTTMHIILGRKVSPEVKHKVEMAVKFTQANSPYYSGSKPKDLTSLL